ncbi:hypothetical protein C8R43DRAFT_1131814 [Mycena crocata]|nr:hypothetical protein C8R43DRAFT_1131814 [Mycena crocata]
MSQCGNIRRKRELSTNFLDEPECLSARHRSFLRALVDYEYKTRRIDLIQWQLTFSQASPGDIPCIMFDFTKETVEFTFVGASTLHAKWRDHVARATRSDGRIQLHFARILDGKATNTRVFPMQSSSTVWANRLERLRRELEEGVGGSAPIHVQLPRRIDALTAATAQQSTLLRGKRS